MPDLPGSALGMRGPSGETVGRRKRSFWRVQLRRGWNAMPTLWNLAPAIKSAHPQPFQTLLPPLSLSPCHRARNV